MHAKMCPLQNEQCPARAQQPAPAHARITSSGTLPSPCYSIRKQYANRRYTNLTAQVADTTRASYPTLVQLTPQGEHTLTNVFENAIKDAEKALDHHSRHR